VHPRAGLDDLEKIKFLTLPGLELRTLGRLARSQSLYRLRHPGSCLDNESVAILPMTECNKTITPWRTVR
jgi:hypothetical protein